MQNSGLEFHKSPNFKRCKSLFEIKIRDDKIIRLQILRLARFKKEASLGGVKRNKIHIQHRNPHQNLHRYQTHMKKIQIPQKECHHQSPK